MFKRFKSKKGPGYYFVITWVSNIATSESSIPFAEAGDSGAWITRVDGKVFGILTGGDPRKGTTFFCRISDIFDDIKDITGAVEVRIAPAPVSIVFSFCKLPSPMSSVIVFGPTGNVASVVAQTAQKHGATVFLAMRDTEKPISGLSTEQEQEGGFKRISADLTNPESVAAAAKISGAKRAFTYLAHGTPDSMRATLTALKSAGIEFVVFLSSFTITSDPRDVAPDEIIPYLHAQVEINLDEIFGPENYVALRPGGFATNLLRFKKGINDGEVRVFAPHFAFDYITPGDMGRVGGTILVQGPRNGQRKVYLYGPKIIPQGEAMLTIGKLLGKEVKVTAISGEEALEQYTRIGIPKPLGDYMVRKSGTPSNELTDRAFYDIGVENVQLYTGKPSMEFEEWVRENSELFNV
ncbi:unnamed protein product [Penicillium glandicola]